MRILAPLKDADEARPLIEAGAEELYCGVLTEEWKREYTNIASMNRRYSGTANLGSVEELEKVCGIAEESSVPVYLTLNEQYYTEEQEERIMGLLSRVEGKISAAIATDIALIENIKENFKMDIHISTGGTSFNSETVRFYRELGASRVIIPRQVTIGEIKKIAKKAKGIELETFAMNTRCPNIDGFCTFQHGLNEIARPAAGGLMKKARMDFHIMDKTQGAPEWAQKMVKRIDLLGSASACQLNYRIESIEGDAKAAENVKKRQQEMTYKNHCAGCALYDFEEAGIASVKIVGRENPTGKKIQDVKYLNALKNRLGEKPGRKEFEEFAKKTYKGTYGRDCREVCYYPG